MNLSGIEIGWIGMQWRSKVVEVCVCIRLNPRFEEKKKKRAEPEHMTWPLFQKVQLSYINFSINMILGEKGSPDWIEVLLPWTFSFILCLDSSSTPEQMKPACCSWNRIAIGINGSARGGVECTVAKTTSGRSTTTDPDKVAWAIGMPAAVRPSDLIIPSQQQLFTYSRKISQNAMQCWKLKSSLQIWNTDTIWHFAFHKLRKPSCGLE